MKRILSIILCFLTGVTCLNAADELPFPRPSSFDTRRIPRDPFTPINSLGTEQTMVVDTAPADGGNKFDPATLFKVSSISINRLSIAIINNRAFGEGEPFDLRGEGKSIQRVTVLKIRDGSVELDYAGKHITVPLTRKEPKPMEAR